MAALVFFGSKEAVIWDSFHQKDIALTSDTEFFQLSEFCFIEGKRFSEIFDCDLVLSWHILYGLQLYLFLLLSEFYDKVSVQNLHGSWSISDFHIQHLMDQIL